MRSRVTTDSVLIQHEQCALRLLEQGLLDDSQHAFLDLLHLRPHHARANLYLGTIAVLQARWTEAVRFFQDSLEASPDCPDAWTLMGTALLQLGHVDDAMQCHMTALRLSPVMPEPHRGLADVYRAQGLLSAAVASYEKAISLRKDYPQACWNLSTTLLLMGDYARGWQFYHHRFSRPVGVVPIATPALQQWRGERLEFDHRLLLVSEQGLGDTLQFARYVRWLRDSGLSVSLMPQASLVGVLRDSGIDVLDPIEAGISSFDSASVWAPLMSVPGLLGVSPQRPLATARYLRVDPGRCRYWRDVLAGFKGLTVALHWQGNPSVELANLKGRSLPLAAFSALAALPGVRLLSLQKGIGSEQLATCDFADRFAVCQPLVDQAWDFRETAAILASCDLVITSDSALAHLAGGLGCPTWLLLHWIPDWRWGLDGDHTFWYPTVRLFRQSEPDNWNEVIMRVVIALQEFKASR